MFIVLLIIAVDIGLFILWKILESYWEHKETIELYTREPTAFLNTPLNRFKESDCCLQTHPPVVESE